MICRIVLINFFFLIEGCGGSAQIKSAGVLLGKTHVLVDVARFFSRAHNEQAVRQWIEGTCMPCFAADALLRGSRKRLKLLSFLPVECMTDFIYHVEAGPARRLID